MSDVRKMSKEEEKREDMDSGYAWIILITGFIVYMNAFGMVCSYGVFVFTFHEFFQCSRKEANMVGALVYAMLQLSGPLASLFYIRSGARMTIVTGALLCSTAYVLSYFASSVYVLMVFQAFAGMGFGLQIVPCITVQTEYFEKYRTLVIGAITIGGAIGLFFFPPLFLYLIDEYGWEGAMLINAGIAAQSLICGCLMRSKKRETQVGIKDLFKFKVFKDFKFYLIAYSAFAWSGCVYTYYSMINSFGVNHGLSVEQSAWVVSVCGIADTVARLVGSVLAHFSLKRCLWIYAIGFQGFGLAILATAFSYVFPLFLTLAVVFGVGFGLLISQFSVVCFHVFGMDRFPSVQGYSFMCAGFGAMTVPLIAGALADETGTLEPSFYFTCGVNFTGVLACLLLILFAGRSRSGEKEDGGAVELKKLTED